MKNDMIHLDEFSEYFISIDEGLKNAITLYKAINIIWQEKERSLCNYENASIDVKDIYLLTCRLLYVVSELSDNVDLMVKSISPHDDYAVLDKVSKIKNENSKKD